jgi:hypothetical protein
MGLFRSLITSHRVSAKLERLGDAVRDSLPVTGFTHSFYRYPARFSPLFAATAIELFTKPGQWVLDPFMGGGTTLVEARRLGRNAIGSDISELASFVAAAKTTLLPEEDLDEVTHWFTSLIPRLNLRRQSITPGGRSEARHLGGRTTWRIRKTIELALADVQRLAKPEQRRFARCVLLKSAQWALDGRSEIPSIEDFRQRILADEGEMRTGLCDLRRAVLHQADHLGYVPSVHCCTAPASSLGENNLFKGARPSLVLTSPPYPGIHVLYHRWQVNGGKETGAPFWISGTLDGRVASHYTFGDRRRQGLVDYYARLRESFDAVYAVAADDVVVVQLVSFSSPETQLERYLSVVRDTGFREVRLSPKGAHRDGRLWRVVPNRKWYTHRTTGGSARLEVVLVHVKAATQPRRTRPIR